MGPRFPRESRRDVSGDLLVWGQAARSSRRKVNPGRSPVRRRLFFCLAVPPRGISRQALDHSGRAPIRPMGCYLISPTMIEPGFPTDEDAQSILFFAQAALDAYLRDDLAALRYLMDLNEAHGHSGIYLATVLLAANLDRARIKPPPGVNSGSDESADSRDVLDALRFASAVHAKDRPTADSIWNRLVAEQRTTDLTIAMLHLHKEMRGEHSDKPQRPN